jgi:putative CocE/NonD family hydrolase
MAGAAASQTSEQSGNPAMEQREEAALGVRFLCPVGWQRIDKSAPGAKALVFSPSPSDILPRISILALPGAVSLEIREAGIMKVVGSKHHRVRLEKTTVLGRPGAVLEYSTEVEPPHRTIEYGVHVGDKFYIFQFAAAADAWPKLAPMFKAAFDSIELSDVAPPPLPPNESSVMVPMRDGVRLETHVVLPPAMAAGQKAPTLLVRSPYYAHYAPDAGYGFDAWRPFTKEGYALVFQAVRGTGKSEGELRPMSQEFADGQDAVRWIAKQPWSNGAVGTFGASYAGFAAVAAAVDTSEVKLVIADGAPSRAFETWPATQNGMIKGQLVWWDRFVKGHENLQEDPKYNRTITNSRPVRDLDTAIFGERDPVWRAALPFMDRRSEYWDNWSLTGKLARICAPVLTLQAKNEYTSDGLDTFLALRGNSCSESVRAAHKFILHAGDHGDAVNHPFAPGPAGEIIRSYVKRYLKDESAAVDAAPIHYFVQNANEWHTSDRWPLAAKTNTYFLDGSSVRLIDRPKGHPAHFGKLAASQPGNEAVVSYTFDPAKDDYCDPNVLSERLAFETPKLSAPLDVAGRAELVLFLKIDTPDADIFAVLLDGSNRPVGQGVGLRLRFRNSMAKPEPMRPGEVVEIHLPFNVAAFRFEAGSPILVTIRSTTCGLSANPNTGGSMTDETATRPVHVQVLTGPDHPSRISLPTL